MKLGNINIQDKLTRAGGIAAGSIAATVVNNKVVPMIFKPKDGEPVDTKLSNGLTMAIGILGPDLLAGQKKGRAKSKAPSFIESVGDGMVASAAQNLVEEFFPGFLDKIGGVGSMGPYYEEESVHGYAGDQFRNAVAGEDGYAAQDKHVS